MTLTLIPCDHCCGTGWRRELATVRVVRRTCARCEGMGLVLGVRS